MAAIKDRVLVGVVSRRVDSDSVCTIQVCDSDLCTTTVGREGGQGGREGGQGGRERKGEKKEGGEG